MDPQSTVPTGWEKRHRIALTLLAFLLPMSFAAERAYAEHTVAESWTVDAIIYHDGGPAGCLIAYVQAQRYEVTPPHGATDLTRSTTILVNRADGQACSSEAVGTSGVALGYTYDSQLTLDPKLMSGTVSAVVPMSPLSDGSPFNFQVELQFAGVIGTLSPYRSTGGYPGGGSAHTSSYTRKALVTGVLSDGIMDYVANAVLTSAVVRSDKTFISTPKPVLLR